MRSGTLCRCGRQHRLVSLAEAPGNPRGRSKRPRELAVDRGTIAEVDQGGARRSRAERQSAGACPQTRLRESYVRFGFRIGDREWGSGWLVTLAVFAIAIGVFFLIALPAWLRDDPVWKSLEGVTSISLASRGAACAVHGNGAVACWGSFREDGPPDRTFVSVSAAQHHACGVTTDRFVVCWRSDGRPWGEPQGERFVSVSSGLDYACGVTSDGSLRCWGAAGFGHGAVPDGKFTAVSIGDYHSCGIRADGFCRLLGRQRPWSGCAARGRLQLTQRRSSLHLRHQGRPVCRVLGGQRRWADHTARGELLLHHRRAEVRVWGEARPLRRLLGTERAGSGDTPARAIHRGECRLQSGLWHHDQRYRCLLGPRSLNRCREHRPGAVYPRQESNLRTWFRKPLLYPLSYGGLPV